jgi:hypothetical protein
VGKKEYPGKHPEPRKKNPPSCVKMVPGEFSVKGELLSKFPSAKKKKKMESFLPRLVGTC